MNELLNLEKELQAVDARKKKLATAAGKLQAEAEILSCLNALRAYGYKTPDVPLDQVARLWERGLEEYIAVYGMDLIKLAVMRFAENDEREYRAFPAIPDIKAVCRKLGRNPKVEYGRRQHEAIVARVKEEQEEQLKAWLTPEKEAELDERFEALKGGDI